LRSQLACRHLQFEIGPVANDEEHQQELEDESARRVQQEEAEGVRVAIGQPEQCTIGVLSRRLLEGANLYQRVLAGNVVTQTATSAMLVPAITTGSADVVLAYRTDTLAETARTDVVDIDSPLAKAVQPFAVARGTKHSQLAARLFDTVLAARGDFEAAGFRWRATTDDAGGEVVER
jgi:ABC-type molybdate transport system substrate-binding protein